MKNFIKLTGVGEQKPIVININNIFSIEDSLGSGGRLISSIGDECVVVKETVSEIVDKIEKAQLKKTKSDNYIGQMLSDIAEELNGIRYHH